MTLSSALHVAQSALMTGAAQSDIAARNIANAGRADYARRTSLLSTNAEGGVETLRTGRAAARAMFAARLAAGAVDAGAGVVRDGLEKLAALGGLHGDSAAGDRIAALAGALDTASENPGDAMAQRAVVDAARRAARALNDASGATQRLRAEADGDIAAAVGETNELLGRFRIANDEVVRAQARGADASDAMDRRDGLLVELSAKLGVHSLTRANGDMALFSEAGATLFDRSPRSVTFTPTPTFDAATRGAVVLVDGAPLAAGSSTGVIAGLLRLRDDIATTYQSQLDETARGLAQAFVETDSSGVAPDALGLFQAPGLTAPPAVGAATGFAAVISIAAAIDPEQGGDPALVRDGGVAGAAYRANASGASGFSDRLHAIADALARPQDFAASAQAGVRVSAADYAASSVSWVEAARADAVQAATYSGALLANVATSLSNATGVNLDDEMAKMLAIENSYRATTKLISTIDSMFQSLLQAVG